MFPSDWELKVKFMRAQYASKASWDHEGRLVSIELDPIPPESSSGTETQPSYVEHPEAERRRVALGAVGGLRRVPR